MRLFYVYKTEWDHYSESKGWVVLANDSNAAKGIALSKTIRSDGDRKNIVVEEIDMSNPAVICDTDYVYKGKKS